jgi:hypothetical protein
MIIFGFFELDQSRLRRLPSFIARALRAGIGACPKVAQDPTD